MTAATHRQARRETPSLSELYAAYQHEAEMLHELIIDDATKAERQAQIERVDEMRTQYETRMDTWRLECLAQRAYNTGCEGPA